MSTRDENNADQGIGIAGFLVQMLSWVVILAIAAMLTVAVLIPRMGGATPYTILTSSMRPMNPPGTLVVVKPIPVQKIAIGDVITYQLESGEAQVVTHRVVEVRRALDGKTTFITKGDANPIVDAKPVMPFQIKGQLWYRAPYLGHVNLMLSGHQRQIATIIVAGGLFLYAGFMFVGSLRDGTRRRKPASSAQGVAA